MDVEPNPGPQQISISNLPNSIKLLFNQAKRTRLKITRYQSRLDNLLAYKNNNLIPKGLKPKCTPAIHSCNPSFWSKWRENLDNLASVQLDLLLDEINNCIRQLKSTFDNQQKELRASLNNDTKRKNRRSRSKRNKTSSQQPEDTVINLSNVQLSEAEIKLLSRGLTFVPTPQGINWSEIQADIDDFARRLRRKEFFDKDGNTATDASSHPFRCKGSWTPPCGREPALDTFITAVQQDLMSSQPAVIRDNLSKQERVAIKKLQKRVDIVVKPADKGSGTVIMDCNW